MSVASGTALARAVRALGAPANVSRAFVAGAPALVRAVKTELTPVDLTTSERLPGSLTEAPFDLIVLATGVEEGSIGEVRDYLQTTARRLRPGEGRLVVYIATLAAPLAPSEAEAPFGPYDALLFPESVAAGDIGASAAALCRLSISTWRLLLTSLGLEIVAEGGQGELRLPSSLFLDHDARLAVFDRSELTTGRVLMVLRHKEARA